MKRNRAIALLVCAILLAASPAAAQELQSSPPPESVVTGGPQNEKLVLPAGTTLKLNLRTGFSTATARPGQPILFTTRQPIAVQNSVVLPTGSEVYGVLGEVKRPGRAKGRGQAVIRLEHVVLPDGNAIALDARLTNVILAGEQSAIEEGRVKGRSARLRDAQTIARGVGIGFLVGLGSTIPRVTTQKENQRSVLIGMAAGAGAGTAIVLLTRGPDLELPRNTMMEATLQQPLVLPATASRFARP